MLTAEQKIRRAVRTLRGLHDEGFDLSILVEAAMHGRETTEQDADYRRVVGEMYAEACGNKPKSEARQRSEKAMKAFRAEKQAAERMGCQ